MTSHIDTIAAGMSAVAAPLIGSKAALLLASTVSESMPPWLAPLLGPAGALVGLVVALRWMAGRLERSESRYDAREAERDADRKALITVVEQNSNVIREVSAAIKGCPGHKP